MDGDSVCKGLYRILFLAASCFLSTINGLVEWLYRYLKMSNFIEPMWRNDKQKYRNVVTKIYFA